MRKELEQMQVIENYINGNLSEVDKMAFEKRLSTDPALQKELQLQRELMQGIKRTAIKQTVKTGLKKYKFNKNLRNFGLSGLVVVAVTAGAFLFYNSVIKTKTNENTAQELPELNEQGQKLWSDADKYLPSQQFQLNPGKDTVIETQDGIVLAIPAHSFLDASGKPATGSIQLEMKEALNAAEIMKAGLNTKSGDKLLETGGMFYINARQDNVSLKIDPNNALYAEIPTSEVKPNMQLFEGKRLPDGTIDWVNPKPLQKDLIPVNILSLNFYPPNYLDSLKVWGYNTKDKAFTDSLYYSFAALFGRSVPAPAAPAAPAKPNIPDSVVSDIAVNPSVLVLSPPNDEITSLSTETKKQDQPKKQAQAIIPPKKLYDSTQTIVCGINPAKIKSIWNDQFQNTLLATREFEERLPFIFNTCNESVLDLYVNNIDNRMAAIDSLAYQLCSRQKFMQFAARGDGKVKNDNKTVQLLKKYYEEKTKEFTAIVTKTKNEFWKKQSEADDLAAAKKKDYSDKDMERINDNFRKELALNIATAAGQATSGNTQSRITYTSSNSKTYGTSIRSSGWFNCDRVVIDMQAVAAITTTATTSRSSLNYTEPVSGAKAVINYQPLAVSVANVKNYDRVLVYLLPDELNSFMHMPDKGEAFEEKLSDLMIYKLVCIAYKGEQTFYFSQDNVKPGKLNLSLIKTDYSVIQDNVNKLGNRNHIKAMNDELNYFSFEKEDAKRRAQVAKIQELTDKVRPVIFPCMANAAAPAPGYVAKK